FARDRAGSAVAVHASSATEKQDSDAVVKVANFEASDRIPRRVPVPVLRPPLNLCKATGVTLSGKRVVLMPDKSGVADALALKLKENGVEVLRLEGAPDSETLIRTLKPWLGSGAIQVV